MSNLFTNFVEIFQEINEPVVYTSPLSMFATQSSGNKEESVSVAENHDSSLSHQNIYMLDLTKGSSLFTTPLLNEQVFNKNTDYNMLEAEIEKLRKLNLEDRKKLENLESEVQILKNLNKSYVNTINQLSSELNSIRMKDKQLINTQVNKLSGELNTVVSKNIFEQNESHLEKSNDVNINQRLVALQSTVRELEELNNIHVNTIKQLNNELAILRSNHTNNEVSVLRKKIEELNTYNQQILIHNNNLARRVMQLQSRY